VSGPDLTFNAEQLRAVEHASGPLLVLAGPGTGKTGVLVAMIAHLVGERGVARMDTCPHLSTRPVGSDVERYESKVLNAWYARIHPSRGVS
jgi:ATP-dependent exoDNAse (exonuclease V) beta subunit